MAVNVRYLTISRIAFELVTALSAEDNIRFNRILFSCFRQLESGEAVRYEETDNAILNIALREAVSELETGFVTYMKRASGGKKDEAKDDQRSTNGQPMVGQSSTKEGIDELDGSDRTRKKQSFHPPLVDEVAAYIAEQGYKIDPERFIDYYVARGWELKPGQKMRDWKAAVRTWAKNQKERGWDNDIHGSRPENRIAGQRDQYADDL